MGLLVWYPTNLEASHSDNREHGEETDFVVTTENLEAWQTCEKLKIERSCGAAGIDLVAAR